MPAAYDPNELNDAEASAKGNNYGTKWSGDNSNYDTKWGGKYGSDTPGHYRSEKKQEPVSSSDAENQVGRGYTGDKGLEKLSEINPSVRGVARFAKSNRGKIIIGGAAAGIITLMIIGFFALLPFKILHIVSNLEKRFFATAENAVDREANALFSQYIKKYVIPGLNTCKAGTTIDKGCTPRDIQGNTIVSKLYKGWRTGRLENKIAEKYGLEFRKVGQNYFIKTPSLPGDGIQLPDGFENSGESLDDVIRNNGNFDRVNRSQLRAAVRSALDDETFYKRVLYRYKIGRLLEEKYGIKRCIVACKLKDNFADWKDNKKNAGKAFLVDRIITPRSASLGLVMQCLIAGATGGSDVCPTTIPGADKPDTTCTTGNCALNGQTRSKWEKNLHDQFAAYRAKYGQTAVQELMDRVEKIRKEGYLSYMFDRAFNNPLNTKADENDAKQHISQDPSDAKDPVKVDEFNKELGKLGRFAKGASIVGTFDTLFEILSGLSKAPAALHKMTYITNAATMVQVWSMYRTYADEVKSGNVDPAIVQSFTRSLEHGIRDPEDSSEQVGGTAGAEQSPHYTQFVSGEKTAQLPFMPTVFAASAANSKNYRCSDGNPLPVGQPVCEELDLRKNDTADQLAAAEKTEPLKTLTRVANRWHDIKNSFFGGIFKAVNWVFSTLTNFVTNVLGITDDLESFFNKLSQWLVAKVIPSPTGSTNSGARTFDMMAGGADLSGNDYAHYGLGGKVVSPQQITLIANDQQSLDKAAYDNQSFFARLLDTESSQAPLAKLAMTMPSDGNSFVANFFSSGKNMLRGLFSGFGLFTNTGQATAAPGGDASIFGVTQYAYTNEDLQKIGDREAYWAAHCAVGDGSTPQVNIEENSQTYNWNKEASDNLNDVTFMPENNTTNPCLLIQAALGSLGATSDPSFLTEDDLAEEAVSPITEGTSGATNISGTVQELAQKILANSNISYPYDPYSPSKGNTEDVLKALARGEKAPVDCANAGVTSADINPNVLKFVLDLGNQTKVGVNALTDKCHMDGSPHYRGQSVDFECQAVTFDLSKADPIAAKYGGKRNGETCANDEHWHYDF